MAAGNESCFKLHDIHLRNTKLVADAGAEQRCMLVAEGKAMISQESENKENKSAVRAFLLEHWLLFVDHVDRYQWPREIERWKELAFCVFHWAGQPHLQAAPARQLIRQLEEFGMLEVGVLAAQADANGEPEFARSELTVMQQLLQRQGVPPERARAAVGTLCQAAAALRRRYGGKVQRYLRHYGQKMLDDLEDEFAFTHLSREDSRQVFTHWLQNVLNMPVPLRDPATLRICKQMNAAPEEVLGAADELDINVAVVDDMFACIADTDSQPERSGGAAAASSAGATNIA
jgi:hypothetical protein